MTIMPVLTKEDIHAVQQYVRDNYDTVMDALQRAGSAIAPATLRELRDAALADEHGHKLRAALAQHALA